MFCQKCHTNLAEGNQTVVIAEEIGKYKTTKANYIVTTTSYSLRERVTIFFCNHCLTKYARMKFLWAVLVGALSILIIALPFNFELPGFVNIICYIIAVYPSGIYSLALFSEAYSDVSFCEDILEEQGQLKSYLGNKVHVFSEKEWNEKH
jgi:hypothetical protein